MRGAGSAAEHRLTGSLGAGSLVLMVVAAASPLTVIAGGSEQWQADGVLRAVCGGVILTGGDNSNTLVARDAATGAEQWNRDGDVIGCDRSRFIINSGTEVMALEAADGRQVWATDLGGAFPMHGSVHDEGLLVIEPGSAPPPTFGLYR